MNFDEQFILAKRVGNITGKTMKNVLGSSFEDIIRELVEKIEGLNQLQEKKQDGDKAPSDKESTLSTTDKGTASSIQSSK